MAESDAPNTKASQPPGDGRPAPVGGHAAEQESPHPQGDDLSSVDASMASEMDVLLEGQFESVDDVLDGLFAEHTAPMPAASAGETFESGEPPPIGQGKTTGIEPPPIDPVNRSAFEKGEQKQQVDPPAGPLEYIPKAGGERPPTDEIVTVDGSLSTVNREPLTASESPPHHPPVQAVEAVEGAGAAGAAAGEVHRPRQRNRLVSALVAVLLAMNMPLHWLPESVRPLVDWIALSLVFWIPVTWVIALLVIGK